MTTSIATLKNVRCFSSGNRALGGTSPPELISAAHAGSFSMALARELGKAGYSPDQIDATATVTMENLPAGWTIIRVNLDVTATVPNALQCDFIDAALSAKKNCAISRLLNVNISMRAKLKRGAAVAQILPRVGIRFGV